MKEETQNKRAAEIEAGVDDIVDIDEIEIDPLEDISEALLEEDIVAAAPPVPTPAPLANNAAKSSPEPAAAAPKIASAPAAPAPQIAETDMPTVKLSSLPEQIPGVSKSSMDALRAALNALPSPDKIKPSPEPEPKIEQKAAEKAPAPPPVKKKEPVKEEPSAPAAKKSSANEQPGFDSDVQQTLAEMSFYEGEESVARGDRLGAISHFRDALSYAPNKLETYLRLADLLAEDSSTVAEAEQLLTKAIELAPNNMDTRTKLSNLREQKNEKREATTPRKGTATSAAAQKKGNTGLLSEVSSEKSKTGAAAANTEKGKTGTLNPGMLGADGQANSGEPARRGKGRPGKGRGRVLASSEDEQRPSSFSAISVLMLIGFALVIFFSWAFLLRGQVVKVQVKLVSPPDEASVPLERLEFSWRSAASNYILIVEENGQEVFKRKTPETHYLLSPADTQLLKPDHRYTWRVEPLSFEGQPLPFVVTDGNFKIMPPMKVITPTGVAPVKRAPAKTKGNK